MFSSYPRHRQHPFQAIIDGDLAEVKAQVQSGRIRIQAIDYAGLTALHYAAWHGHLKIADYLLDQGASVWAKTLNTHESALDLIQRADDLISIERTRMIALLRERAGLAPVPSIDRQRIG